MDSNKVAENNEPLLPVAEPSDDKLNAKQVNYAIELVEG